VDARLDENGWMHLGDIGFIRADGHLRLMGGYKDMLKIGGENVDPLEVEASIRQSRRPPWLASPMRARARLPWLSFKPCPGNGSRRGGWQNTAAAALQATKFHVTSSWLRSFP